MPRKCSVRRLHIYICAFKEFSDFLSIGGEEHSNEQFRLLDELQFGRGQDAEYFPHGGHRGPNGERLEIRLRVIWVDTELFNHSLRDNLSPLLANAGPNPLFKGHANNYRLMGFSMAAAAFHEDWNHVMRKRVFALRPFSIGPNSGQMKIRTDARVYRAYGKRLKNSVGFLG